MIIVGILLIVSLILFVTGICFIFNGKGAYGLPIVILGTLVAIMGIFIDENEPTKQDILDGKAVYQDTINPYGPVWKLENF